MFYKLGRVDLLRGFPQIDGLSEGVVRAPQQSESHQSEKIAHKAAEKPHYFCRQFFRNL